MQKLILIQYFALFTLDLLERYKMIPRQLTWFTDVVSAILMILVIFMLIRKRTLAIRFSYIFVAMILIIHIIFGLIFNGAPSGAIFQGIRTYFKYIPFFLLPVVYTFSDSEIKSQIKFLLLASIIQLPITLYQRFIEGAGIASGDLVRGSFVASSMLSIYLIAIFSVCLSYYFKKQLSATSFLLLTLILLLPTTINETKGTLFLLPFALLIPALMSGTLTEKIRRVIGGALIAIVFFIAFAVIYDTYMSSRYGESAVITFFTTDNRLEGYLAPQSSGLRTNLAPGRVDIILDYFKATDDDPLKMIFGFGMSNLSPSFLGRDFAGAYHEKYGDYIYTTIAKLLWELGLLGTMLVLWLWYLIFLDAKKMANLNNYNGAIALGMLGVLGVFTVGIFYKNILQSNIISTIFWFFSGYIALKSYEIKLSRRSS